MLRTLALFACFACLALGASAYAQTIYKCVSQGKVSYGELPCSAGTQSTLAVPAAPPPDPHLQQRLARQKALAESLDQQRRDAAAHTAKAARPVRAAGVTAQQQRCDKLRLQLRWAQEDLRRAAGPGTEPLRLKVQRQAEAMAVQCPP